MSQPLVGSEHYVWCDRDRCGEFWHRGPEVQIRTVGGHLVPMWLTRLARASGDVCMVINDVLIVPVDSMQVAMLDLVQPMHQKVTG